MPYTAKNIPEFESAIAEREEQIKDLHTNPPSGWAPRYVTHNINLLQEQIGNFKKLIAGIKDA